MERKILTDLCKWKESKRRKPLILRGARQVGKTWVLQEFGKRYFSDCLYVNFERQEEYKQFFQTTKDVNRILQNLSMACGKKITTDTLIIFDEIQACEEALNLRGRSRILRCKRGIASRLEAVAGFPRR